MQRELGLEATPELRDQWRVHRELLNLAPLMSFVAQTLTQQSDANLTRSVDVYPPRRLEMTLA